MISNELTNVNEPNVKCYWEDDKSCRMSSCVFPFV